MKRKNKTVSVIKLTEEQIEEIYQKNKENIKIPPQPFHPKSYFTAIEKQEKENSKYYKSLPKWFNYSKDGNLINNCKSYKAFIKMKRNKSTQTKRKVK